MFFEVFTDSDDESRALELMLNIDQDPKVKAKNKARVVVKQMFGEKSIAFLKKVIR